MDLMYGFLTQETAEYYTFLKGKVESGKNKSGT